MVGALVCAGGFVSMVRSATAAPSRRRTTEPSPSCESTRNSAGPGRETTVKIKSRGSMEGANTAVSGGAEQLLAEPI